MGDRAEGPLGTERANPAIRDEVPSLEADWDTFCAIEDEIGAAESTGIEARWRCGRMLLRYEKRQGSKRSALVDAVRRLSSEFSLSETELYDRRQFAEDYPDFSDASEKFSSWRSVLEGGLGQRGKRAPAERPPAPPVPEGQYSLVYADPPWQYANKATRGAAEKHYPTLSVAAVLRLPLGFRQLGVFGVLLHELREHGPLVAVWALHGDQPAEAGQLHVEKREPVELVHNPDARCAVIGHHGVTARRRSSTS